MRRIRELELSHQFNKDLGNINRAEIALSQIEHLKKKLNGKVKSDN